MIGQARCGVSKGTPLERWPVIEMTWDVWSSLYPSTLVLAGDQGFGTEEIPWSYEAETYPYGDYETSNSFFSAAMPALDTRRQIKERVFGVPSSATDAGIAFPFGELAESGEGRYRVVDFTYEGSPAVLLWDGTAEGGFAVRPTTMAGQALTITAGEGGFLDDDTGSAWSIDGVARSGTLIGSRLVPIAEAYVAFWGAWAAFHAEALSGRTSGPSDAQRDCPSGEQLHHRLRLRTRTWRDPTGRERVRPWTPRHIVSEP
jgi:hypothetical protein